MVIGTAVDSNVLSYLVLAIMKEQGAVVGRGRASPLPSGEAEPALCHQARRSGASPQPSGEAEPALGRRARRSLALGGRARRNKSLQQPI